MESIRKITFKSLLICCFAFFSISMTAQGVLPSGGVFRLQNVATGQFLAGADSSTSAVTMSNSGDDPSTHFRIVQSGSFYNIDSDILGVIRAPGASGPAGAFVVVSTATNSPTTDTDKTWTLSYNSTEDTYRFESQTAGRFMYQELNGDVTHVVAPDTDDRSNWELIPFVGIAPDEDTNPDLACPDSGIYQNNTTTNVDIPNSDNVGTADDRTCYSDYSESSVYGQTWGVYNITVNSNHWDPPNTLQPRIERSLSRSKETGVGSYARFTGTLRILEVGDAAGTNDDGSYLMQAKGKHLWGGGSADPAICLYLAKPIYGDDGNGNQVQISFDIYREQINYRGGEGSSGRTLVFLKNVAKNEIVDIELEVGFREDPNDPNLKIHYSDAIIGGDAFNWNIPHPERGLESGIRYGAYRVKGGRAQMRWANTTYEKAEVVDDSEVVVKLKNVETEEFLTTAGGSAQPVTMSNSGTEQNTHWTLAKNGAYYNIDSQSDSGGTGILRAPGAGGPAGPYVVVSTLIAPPSSDTDKTWTIDYDGTTHTYRFESSTAGRFLYHNTDGTVTHSIAPPTDNRSVWEIIICPSCSLSHSIVNMQYDYQGTPYDAADDTYTFDLIVSGTGASQTWDTDDPNIIGGNYSTSLPQGPFLVANGDLDFSVFDTLNSNCSTQVTVTAPTCGQVLSLATDPIFPNTYLAEQLIESTAHHTSQGITLTYIAGQEISLDPGFSVDTNTIFEAYIGPCNSN